MTESPREQRLHPLPSAKGNDAGKDSCAQRAPLSDKRRRLLKAAASAGPIIATLPSGEALAMASSLQCVINVQEGADTPPGVTFKENEDLFVRVKGTVERWFSFKTPAGLRQH